MRHRYMFKAVILLLVLLMGTVGCGKEKDGHPETTEKYGSIMFDIESPKLASTQVRAKAIDLTMTFATINLYHQSTGTSATLELTIEDNKASGRLDDLEVGLWDIQADVQTAEGYYFMGQDQVTVEAGIAVGANLLLDADDGNYQVGSVIFNIGFNPLPGYKRLDGVSSDTALACDNGFIAFTDAGEMMMYDSMLENPVPFAMPYAQAPVVSCIGATGDKAYVGYVIYEDEWTRDIEIFEVDLMSGSFISIAISPNVVSIQSIEDVLILISADQNEFSEFRIYNLSTLSWGGHPLGQGGTEFVYNPSNNMMYHANNDMFESYLVDYDSYSGNYNIGFQNYIDYSGIYTLDSPMALMANKGRLITGSGDMFYSSIDPAIDMTHAGNIGKTFVDFQYLSGDSYIFLVSGGTDKELVVIDDINYLPVTSVSLDGNHKKLFVTDQFVYVLAEYEEAVFGKVWDKSFLIDHL